MAALLIAHSAALRAPSAVLHPTPAVSSLPPRLAAVNMQTGFDWINPVYWNRQYIGAAHVSNNVAGGSRVIELGSDAKTLYYLTSPAGVTIISTLPFKQEAPLREAAAKLNIPLDLYSASPGAP